jgi:hypothetical protein
VGLTTQETIGFAGDQEGTGIIMGSLFCRLLICPGGRAALHPAIKSDTHLAGILGESERKIGKRSQQDKPKQTSNDGGF